jgi:outer membrane immunogenic protein
MNQRLRKALAAAVLTAGSAITGVGVAHADGVAAAAPAKVEAPFSWTGFYTGVNAGWSRQEFDWRFHPAIPGAINQAFDIGRNEGEYGAMIGYNYMFGGFLLGIEGGFDKIGLTNTWARHLGYGTGAGGQAQANLNNIFTIGPRVGFAFNKWLTFATGGWATGTVQTRDIVTATGLEVPGLRTDRDQDGWFAGGGLEYAATANWIIGLEYQHVSLDNEHHRVGPVVSFDDHNVTADADIVRFRFSFRWSPEHFATTAPLK